MFAARVKDCWHGPVSFIPDDVKFLLKPVQRSVKDVSKTINDSPWGHLAATPSHKPPAGVLSAQSKSTTSIAGMATANNTLTQSSLLQHQRNQAPTAPHRQPQLSLSTRGAPPPNPLDPLSAASTHSASGLGINSSGYATPSVTGPNTSFNGGILPFASVPPPPMPIGSGYVTPLPATPMSAALGPAAGVTVALPVSLQLAALAGGGGVGNITGTSSGGGMNMSMGGLGGLLPSAMTGGGGGGPPPPQQGVNGGGVNVGSGLLSPTSTAGAVGVGIGGGGIGSGLVPTVGPSAPNGLLPMPNTSVMSSVLSAGLPMGLTMGGGAPGPAVLLSNGVVSPSSSSAAAAAAVGLGAGAGAGPAAVGGAVNGVGGLGVGGTGGVGGGLVPHLPMAVVVGGGGGLGGGGGGGGVGGVGGVGGGGGGLAPNVVERSRSLSQRRMG